MPARAPEQLIRAAPPGGDACKEGPRKEAAISFVLMFSFGGLVCCLFGHGVKPQCQGEVQDRHLFAMPQYRKSIGAHRIHPLLGCCSSRASEAKSLRTKAINSHSDRGALPRRRATSPGLHCFGPESPFLPPYSTAIPQTRKRAHAMWTPVSIQSRNHTMLCPSRGHRWDGR